MKTLSSAAGHFVSGFVPGSKCDPAPGGTRFFRCPRNSYSQFGNTYIYKNRVFSTCHLKADFGAQTLESVREERFQRSPIPLPPARRILAAPPLPAKIMLWPKEVLHFALSLFFLSLLPPGRRGNLREV